MPYKLYRSVCTDYVQCLQATLGWSGLPDAGRFNFGLGHHEQIQVTQASSDGPRWQPIFVCPHGRRPDLACPAAGSASHFVQTETEANRPPANSTRNGQPRPKNTQLEVSLMARAGRKAHYALRGTGNANGLLSTKSEHIRRNWATGPALTRRQDTLATVTGTGMQPGRPVRSDRPPPPRRRSL